MTISGKKYPKKEPIKQPENISGDSKQYVDYFNPPFEDVASEGSPDLTLSLYDPLNADSSYTDAIEQEYLAICSPPSQLFRLDRNKTEINRVTGEAKFRYYSNPVTVYGIYDDYAFENVLMRWGIEEQITLDMTFNLNWLNSKANGQIKEGDVVQTHDGRLWEVQSSILKAETLFKLRHNVITLKRLQGDNYKLPGIK